MEKIRQLIREDINVTAVTTYHKSSGTSSTSGTNGARNAAGTRETRSPSNTRESLWEENRINTQTQMSLRRKRAAEAVLSSASYPERKCQLPAVLTVAPLAPVRPFAPGLPYERKEKGTH